MGQPAATERRRLKALSHSFTLDCVIGGEWEGEARRSMAVLPKRLARCGLRLHPPQTALIAFRKPEAPQGIDPGNGTVDFLGLPHDWSRSRRGVSVGGRVSNHRLYPEVRSIPPDWRNFRLAKIMNLLVTQMRLAGPQPETIRRDTRMFIAICRLQPRAPLIVCAQFTAGFRRKGTLHDDRRHP